MTRGPSSSEALAPRGLPGAAAARSRDGLARGFTFLELLVVMGVMAVFFGLAFSWISALIGMSVRDPEAAQAAGFIWIFPLVFASSAFVPIASMPSWLQVFTRNNPVTHTIDAIRDMILSRPVWHDLWLSLLWIAGILVVFVPLAVNRYRNAT